MKLGQLVITIEIFFYNIYAENKTGRLVQDLFIF